MRIQRSMRSQSLLAAFRRRRHCPGFQPIEGRAEQEIGSAHARHLMAEAETAVRSADCMSAARRRWRRRSRRISPGVRPATQAWRVGTWTGCAEDPQAARSPTSAKIFSRLLRRRWFDCDLLHAYRPATASGNGDRHGKSRRSSWRRWSISAAAPCRRLALVVFTVGNPRKVSPGKIKPIRL